MFGSMPGGLGITTIVAGCILGSISGSNVATVAALSFLIVYMRRSGYPAPFAVAVVAAGCTFGVVIPPSMGFIIYGVITDTSVAKLFASGVFPGLLLAALFSMYAYLYARRRNPRGAVRNRSWPVFRAAAKDAVWGLICPVIVLGGICSGVLTPTEAAAVAVAYVFIVGMFIERKLAFAELPRIIFDAGQTVGVVVFAIATSALFGWLLQTQGLVAPLAETLMETCAGNKILVLLAINAILIAAGAFIEPVAAMYMLLPVFTPVLARLGVDMTHFGAVMNVNLSMAHLTPPAGLSLYIAARVGGVPFARACREAVPFMLCEAAVLLLVTYVPPIALTLPGLLR
jgi:C4-dicarboxylate transporter DctM subunit